MALITRKSQLASSGAYLADLAHAFCPCQSGAPLEARRSVCDTVRGHGEDAPPDAERCVVCLDLVTSRSGWWCGHG